MITKTVSKSIKSFQYNQNYPPQAFSLSYFSYLCSVNQRYHISLIFFTLLLTACIGGNRVSDALQTADKLIFVAPDSAVAMLDSLDLDHASRAQRALHALLLTKAREKANITVTDDSLIAIAADYYRGHGDSLEVQSRFYHGVILGYRDDYPRALLSLIQAADLADAIGDDFYRAMACREQVGVYTKLYEFDRAARLGEEAVRAFNRAGRPLHAAWERVFIPQSLLYSGNVDAACDSIAVLATDSLIHSDWYLHNKFLSIATNVYFEKHDYEQSESYFDTYIEEGEPSSKLLSQMATLKLKTGQQSEALELIDRSFATAKTHSDTIGAQISLTEYLEFNEEFKEAYYLLRSTQNDLLPRLNTLITHPFTAYISDVYRTQNNENKIKRKAAEQQALAWAFIALLSVILLIFIIYLYRKNLRQKALENQILLSDLDRLKAEIIDLQSKDAAKHQENSDNKLPGYILNDICEARYTLLPSDEHYKKFGKQIVDFIDTINSTEVMEDLERLVNLINNNLMARFRQQLPTLPNNYYKVAVLTFAGFSNYSIICITKLKDGSYRNIRSKIRSAIKTSNCEDCDLFLSHF